MAAAADVPRHFCMLTDKQYYSHVNTRGVNEVITGVMSLCLQYGVQRNENGIQDVDKAIREFLQREKEKHDKLTTNKKKKKTWYGRHGKNYVKETFKELDPTDLLEIISKVTEIRQENDDPNFKSLFSSLREIKDIRNAIVHVNKNATYSEETMTRISDKVNEIVDKLATLYRIESSKVNLIKVHFQNEIKRIQDPQQSNEADIKNEIQQRVIKENAEKWAPMILKSMECEKLQFSNKEVLRSDIFHQIEFNISDSHHDISEGVDSLGCKTFTCTDILTLENSTQIDIIEGEPGSGKSTFLRMMSLEFCRKRTDSIFKSISLYMMMILINCRDKENIRNFWQYFKTHYSETARKFPKKWVIFALREMKMIIAIDGLDEANETSKALVRDVIHNFGGFGTVRFLITTRPGFSKNVVEQFGNKALAYRILHIKPIENSNDQEKFINRVIKQIPSINSAEIMKTFRTKRDEFNSHFLRPLDLILFVTLFLRFPKKMETLTHELSFMQLSYAMHEENMTNRMPDVINNPLICSTDILKLLGRKSLKLIQNNTYEIDQENFVNLADESCKINKNIPVESILSCVLIKRKCERTIRAVRDFSHRSQQEYFASKVLTNRLHEEYEESDISNGVEKANSGDFLKSLRELTGERVKKGDLYRLVTKKKVLN